MGKIIAICGKIASGKSHYARNTLLQADPHAVILSCDELMRTIFPYDLGTDFDAVSRRCMQYLHHKATDLCHAGCTVILDWGFWTKQDRDKTKLLYLSQGIPFEMHYVDVSDATWHERIHARNQAVTNGNTTDFYVDQGLLDKLNAHFEAPEPNEIDRWIRQ